jgi:hypothetical protein
MGLYIPLAETCLCVAAPLSVFLLRPFHSAAKIRYSGVRQSSSAALSSANLPYCIILPLTISINSAL